MEKEKLRGKGGEVGETGRRPGGYRGKTREEGTKKHRRYAGTLRGGNGLSLLS